MYHGDIRLGDTIDIKFTTVNTSGVPTTLAGTPVISAYVDNSLTELTAGITLTVDFDARTGLHNVRVVATSGNGYTTNTEIQLVITTGTVGGSSVVGYVIGTFSIEKRSLNKWLGTAPNALIAGRVDANAQAMAAAVIAAGTFAAGAIDAAAIATDAIGSAEFAQAAADKVWASVTRSLTDKVGFDLTAAAKEDVIKAVGGTADAGGSTTTIVDAERTEADTDYWKGSVVLITSGAAIGQARRISAFNAATDTLTVSPAFTQSIAAGVTYIILRTVAAEVLVDAIKASAIDATAIAAAAITAAKFATGAIDAAAVGTAAIDADALAAGAITAATFAAGAIDASAIAAAAITAAKFAANAIDAAAIAPDAIGASEFNQGAADKVFGTGAATLAELAQGVPSATPRPDQAMMLLYMALRNRLQVTATEKRVTNDALTVIAKKSLTDDGTTYQEEKMVTGP